MLQTTYGTYKQTAVNFIMMFQTTYWNLMKLGEFYYTVSNYLLEPYQTAVNFIIMFLITYWNLIKYP